MYFFDVKAQQRLDGPRLVPPFLDKVERSAN